MRFCLLLAVFLAAFSSCNRNNDDIGLKDPPDGVIAYDRMVDILVDYHWSENAIKYLMRYGASPGPLSERIYETVLEKHGISRQEFAQSMAYYSSDPVRMEALYTSVMEELSSLQGQLGGG